MRFLIQKINKEIRHDFAFTLLESIRYQKWKQGEDADVVVKYVNCADLSDGAVWFFKPFHQHYIPIGSVEFVTSWFERFHNHTPKPINIPYELNEPVFTKRPVINGTHKDIPKNGKWFVKSNDSIKKYAELLDCDSRDGLFLPKGNYQMSEYIDIGSEWRCFVYQGKLVGLQNYSGGFSTFPDIPSILHMVHAYKDAPVAYTLDVGVNNYSTFVIEVHDFFSCGLYGFANHDILPFMYSRWHYEYLKNTVYGTK